MEYNGIVRLVAEGLHAGLIDVERLLGSHDGSLMLPDGIHLSPNGHLRYHEVVRNVLEPLVGNGILGSTESAVRRDNRSGAGV